MNKYFIFAIFLSICVACTNGWGEEGHMIVAQIASNFVTPTASNILNTFLDGGSYTLPSIAPLPDDYDHTPEGKWSADCHYCNLPNGATSFNMGDCGTCCVVGAIQNYTTILSSEEGSPFACNFDQSDGIEPCALEFLVHFVGDVHQPLHVGYASDRGGNEVTVDFYGVKTNLHTVWDTKIIEKWTSDFNNGSDILLALIASNPSTVKQYLSQMDPIEWANESFDFVRSTCYNYTENSSGVPQLDEDYYDHNLPIIQWRLAAAGVRLGALLNSILTGYSF